MSTNSGCNITAHQVFGMCAAGDAARRLTQIEPQFRFIYLFSYILLFEKLLFLVTWHTDLNIVAGFYILYFFFLVSLFGQIDF